MRPAPAVGEAKETEGGDEGMMRVVTGGLLS